MTNDVIVLATSAINEQFRRDFLTCIASPKEHRVSFVYRAVWWQDGLLDNAASLIGRPALIVFCEAGRNDYRFLPLRHARITGLEPAGPIAARGLANDTQVTVTFSLGEFVRVSDRDMATLQRQWNTWIRASEDRPRVRSQPERSTSRFVFALDGFTEPDTGSEEESWTTLSKTLARFASLNGAYFFRVSGFVEHSTKTPAPTVTGTADTLLSMVYPLQTNRQYILTLDAYSKSGSMPVTDVVRVATTSEKLSIQATQAPSAGLSPKLLVVMDSGAVSWPQLATLTICGTAGQEGHTPRVDMVTKISPRRIDVAILMVVLALGALLAGLSEGDLGLPVWAVYVLKAAGGIAIAIAGYLGVRRAPGLGS